MFKQEHVGVQSVLETPGLGTPGSSFDCLFTLLLYSVDLSYSIFSDNFVYAECFLADFYGMPYMQSSHWLCRSYVLGQGRSVLFSNA